MKIKFLITAVALTSFLSVWEVPLKVINPGLVQASAQELSVNQKVELIAKNKGQFGSGDQLRRFFFGDLDPIGIQTGGAGHVVNLYNKTNNVTFSYCSTYDVVVAVKRGKIAQFNPNEVK